MRALGRGSLALRSSQYSQSLYPVISLELAPERFREDGGHEGVEFGGGFGLEFFQGVHLSLKVVEIGNDTALFFGWWNYERNFPHISLVESCLSGAINFPY